MISKLHLWELFGEVLKESHILDQINTWHVTSHEMKNMESLNSFKKLKEKEEFLDWPSRL